MDAQPHLTPEQVQALQEARERAKPILSAARVAGFNGWSVAVFAGLTLLFGLGSPALMLLAVGMAVVARNELRGRDLLRRLDPAGPDLLTRNQLGFMALLVAYCGWSLLGALTDPDPQWAVLEELLGLEPAYIQDLTAAGYLAAILLTVLLVGLNARFYHRRRALLGGYLAATPAWVVEMQRAASVD